MISDRNTTVTGPEWFQNGVEKAVLERLRQRRVVCVIARGLVGFAAAVVLVLLLAALFANAIYWVVLIVAEVHLFRLGRALSDDLKWPQLHTVKGTPDWP